LVAPGLTDKYMEKTMFAQQQTDRPSHYRPSGLYQASGDLRERGGYEGHVAETSLHTEAALHPVLTGAAMLGAGLALAGVWKAKERRSWF
jgi:hypothetical protein